MTACSSLDITLDAVSRPRTAQGCWNLGLAGRAEKAGIRSYPASGMPTRIHVELNDAKTSHISSAAAHEMWDT